MWEDEFDLRPGCTPCESSVISLAKAVCGRWVKVAPMKSLDPFEVSERFHHKVVTFGPDAEDYADMLVTAALEEGWICKRLGPRDIYITVIID